MGETIFQHTENHSKIPYFEDDTLEVYEGFGQNICSLSKNNEANERVKTILSSQGPIIK